MELKEMIKVMQHFEDGGEVEYALNEDEYIEWCKCVNPIWDWYEFKYRIIEPKQKITIEKWLMRSILDGEFRIIETSLVDTVASFKKVKLLETYEVEL